MGEHDELITIERVAVLQRVGLFAGVPGGDLAAVARMMDEVRLDAGVTFIRRGALEDWLFVVAYGEIEIHLDAASIGRAGPGSVVGELAVLAPAPRSASVTTLTPTLLLRLRHEPFNELLDDHPEMSRALITTLARQLQANADGMAASG
jgi:CRP/FNR family cyclic AMP-dependent transcriptional regulator